MAPRMGPPSEHRLFHAGSMTPSHDPYQDGPQVCTRRAAPHALRSGGCCRSGALRRVRVVSEVTRAEAAERGQTPNPYEAGTPSTPHDAFNPNNAVSTPADPHGWEASTPATPGNFAAASPMDAGTPATPSAYGQYAPGYAGTPGGLPGKTPGTPGDAGTPYTPATPGGSAGWQPPPSLPYKVDTSRPSLRTNWTRLVHPSVLIGHVLCRRPSSSAPAPRPRRALPAPRPGAPTQHPCGGHANLLCIVPILVCSNFSSFQF